MASDAQLFEEDFRVDKLSEKKYDRVDRLYCTSLNNETTMDLDVNNELFPGNPGDTLHVVVATTLALDGSKDDDKGWRDLAKSVTGEEPSLADMYDYVMHGKVYKFEDGDSAKETIKVYASFGGLLMAMEGPYKKLTPLRVEYIYLLVKRS